MRPEPGEEGAGDADVDDAVNDVGDDGAPVRAEPDRVGDEGERIGENAGGRGDLEDFREGRRAGKRDPREVGDERAADDVDDEGGDHLAAHRLGRRPDAEVADRASLQRLADLLRFHRLPIAEVGEDVVAGLDAAPADVVHETVLVGEPDEVRLVMGQGHPDDGGYDPDGGRREEVGEPGGGQEVHGSPFFGELAYQYRRVPQCLGGVRFKILLYQTVCPT